MTDPTPQDLAQLAEVRKLVALGVPAFLGRPAFDENGERDWHAGAGGFLLPRGWQKKAKANPDLLDKWEPGMAVCLVTGHAFDVLDVDTQADGPASYEELELLGEAPEAHARVATPSGGWHDYIAPTKRAKSLGLLPGIDVQAGTPDGEGLGFVFAPPTVKRSKLTGDEAPYLFQITPRGVAPEGDTSNAALVARMDARKTDKPKRTAAQQTDGDPFEPLGEDERAKLVAIQNKEIARVRESEAGRNNAVSHALCVLYPFVHGGHLDRDEVDQAVWDAIPSGSHHYERHEFQASADWAWENSEPARPFVPDPLAAFADLDDDLDVAATPARVPEDRKKRATVPADLKAAPEQIADRDASGLPKVFDPQTLSPVVLAEAALRASVGTYRFAMDEQAWYVYDPKAGCWHRSNATPLAVARTILARLADAAPKGASGESATELEQAQEKRHKLLTNSATRGQLAQLMLDEVQRRGIIAGDLDADPFTLWAGGTCYDLRASVAGPVLASVPAKSVHTKAARFAPVAGPHPQFDALMGAMFPDDEIREFALNVFGQAVTGHSSRALGILYGDTGLGKTTLLTAVSWVLGNYATQLDPDLLDAKRANEFKVYDLKGIRLGWVDEGPTDNRAGRERLKALTGGAQLRGATKGKPSVVFHPTHTLFFTDNREPEVADRAIMDRVKALRIDGEREAVHPAAAPFQRDLAAWGGREGAAVLEMLIRRAAAYLADPDVLQSPAKIAADLEALRREQDPILSWLDERTDPVQADRGAFARDLYTDFRDWAVESGTPRSTIPTMTGWGRFMSKLGIEKKSTRDGIRRGVALRPGGILAED